MVKLFPKSRICAIDCFPSFKKGIDSALKFAVKNNISLTTKDGVRLMLGHCLQFIESDFKQVKSTYPKVIYMSKQKMSCRLQLFVETHFDKLMRHLPYPYCGEFDTSSPDLESAAENCLKTIKTQKKFKEFLNRKVKLKTVNN
jgi:hypothetical protein